MSDENEGKYDLAMVQVSEDEYRGLNGASMKREHGETPNGNAIGGKWVLRNPKGRFMDFDKYRHDLAARNRLRLISNAKANNGGTQ